MAVIQMLVLIKRLWVKSLMMRTLEGLATAKGFDRDCSAILGSTNSSRIAFSTANAPISSE